MATDADGDFVVVWMSPQDGSYYGVFARRFSSSGAPLATEFQVNTFTGNRQSLPAVGVDADGDFVASWESYGDQDASTYGVFARRFSSAGAALATEFQVNTFTPSQQRFPSVGVDADGDFVVAWQSDAQDGGGLGVFGRRFSNATVPLAAEFQVNAFTTGSQGAPAMTADADGDFVVAWTSVSQDGSSLGVFAQRFANPVDLDVDGDGEAEALTDGLLALRYLFGFRGPTLVTGAVDLAGCTRCNAAVIEAYLAGHTT